MITREELNEVLNKKVMITSVSNGVQIYKDTLNKTGMIHCISGEKYGILIEGLKHPSNKLGVFWFERSNFTIVKEIIEKEESDNMKHLVERIFARAKIKLNDIFEQEKQHRLSLDDSFQRAMSLVEELHSINEEIIDQKNYIHATRQIIQLDPLAFASNETVKSIMALEEKLYDYKKYLENKEQDILIQLDAYSSLPLEQERILISYGVLSDNATVKPVSPKKLTQLLDISELFS